MHPEPAPSNLDCFLNGSLALDTDHDLPRRPKKRRKTVEAATSSVANGKSPDDNPDLKYLEPQKRSTRRSGKSINEIGKNTEDFLTLARVDINLVCLTAC